MNDSARLLVTMASLTVLLPVSASAQNGAFRVGQVVVANGHYLLFDRDTFFKNYRVEVYRNDGRKLFQSPVFATAQSSEDRQAPPEILGVLERMNVVLYAGAGRLYAYDYVTNHETELVVSHAPERPPRLSSFRFDPVGGVVLRKLESDEGAGPFSFEIDVAANIATPLPLPGSATPVRKRADGSYLAFENTSTWKGSEVVDQRFTLWNFRPGQAPRPLARGGGRVTGIVGDVLVVEGRKSEVSLYELETGKPAGGSPNRVAFIGRNGKETWFLDEESYVLTRTGVSGKPGKPGRVSIQMPRLYNTRSLFARHPATGELLYFNSTTRQFTVPSSGAPESWPVVLLQSGQPPLKSSHSCRFAAVLRESVDVRGGSLDSTRKGIYSWAHDAQRAIDFINTAWEDIDEDGANDLLIQYVNWKPELEAVDILFGDGKGGFSGRRRIKCPGKLYTAPGILRLHSAENTDHQPWVGCHIRHNKATNQLDVFEVKDLSTSGSTYKPENNCEQSIGAEGYEYHFFAQAKQVEGEWSLLQDNQPLTRALEFRHRYNNTDYNQDGKTDNVSVSDGNSRRFPGAQVPAGKTITFYLSSAGGGSSTETVHSLPGDVQAAQVGDFNGDGFPDLAIAFEQDRHQLMIVYGGKAPEARQYRVKATLDTMLPVDLDADGRAELTSRHGGDLDITSFDSAMAIVREQRIGDIRFSEYNYAAFDRINADGTLDYAAISLYDSRKGEISVTPYLGEFSQNQYVLHGAKQKWMDFEGQMAANLKAYNAWKARQEASKSSSRKVCIVCSGSGTSVRNSTTECKLCRSCGGSGRFTSGGYGGASSRYETWNGREVMVTRFYNSYSSTRCSSCGGTGEVCYEGYAPCEHCGGSGREP
ncbi:MAG: VCBS repeat-containing protein [Myxococcus sp.]|nr:VCBS repeat-containing protein [Myxococcus sp.]